MKKRLEKKKERMVRREIHNLLDAILDINGIAERNQDVSGKLPTAFFEFSGHIAEVNCSVCGEGWYPCSKHDFFVRVDLVPYKLSEETKKLKKKYGVTR